MHQAFYYAIGVKKMFFFVTFLKGSHGMLNCSHYVCDVMAHTVVRNSPLHAFGKEWVQCNKTRLSTKSRLLWLWSTSPASGMPYQTLQEANGNKGKPTSHRKAYEDVTSTYEVQGHIFTIVLLEGIKHSAWGIYMLTKDKSKGRVQSKDFWNGLSCWLLSVPFFNVLKFWGMGISQLPFHDSDWPSWAGKMYSMISMDYCHLIWIYCLTLSSMPLIQSSFLSLEANTSLKSIVFGTHCYNIIKLAQVHALYKPMKEHK